MKTQRLITTVLTSGFILLLTICAFLYSTSTEMAKSTSNTFSFVLLGIILIGSLFSFLKSVIPLFLDFYYRFEEYRRKHSYLRAVQKIQMLQEDFSEIKFKNFETSPLADFVTEDSIACRARLDQDGNVIYQIRVNAKMSTDDYVWFLKNFSISQSQNE